MHWYNEKYYRQWSEEGWWRQNRVKECPKNDTRPNKSENLKKSYKVMSMKINHTELHHTKITKNQCQGEIL